MSIPGGHSPGLLGTYFFQMACTAFILRRRSVVKWMVVVASQAWPRFCCAILMGMPPAIAWLACDRCI